MLNPIKIPLSLYIHIPWCVKKCPYCDFNSHEVKSEINYDDYVDALIADARSQLGFVQNREISSVFIGGGTPSLLPIKQYHRLFDELKSLFIFTKNIEITMEANPATVEHAPFEQYLEVGINRLSLGVQTFNTQRLQTLGRIHNDQQAMQAIQAARKAGFKRLNVDLMHGLPNQSVEEAMYDIKQALLAGATHISWYQLTIEPNTVFYRNQPVLPNEEVLGKIEEQGTSLLTDNGFCNYEVSAWVGENDNRCKHNVNYWQFGDYLAIGAGAHGKVTLKDMQISELPSHIHQGVYRFYKPRSPKDYVSFDKTKNYPKFLGWKAVCSKEIVTEFMLDALRLSDGFTRQMFEERTGHEFASIEPKLSELESKGLINKTKNKIHTSELGRRYLNKILEYFI